MQPAAKTLLFVAIACGSTIAAFATHRTFQVDLTKKISDEGEEFFPDFTDPNTATSLAVAAYDSSAARVNDFKVEFSDGKWRIPSHNNYPADGKDRLRETAASVIGVRREVQVGESADDHRRYNLLDPLAENVSGDEGRGTRITIKDGDKVLVDYIVGKKVENVAGDVYYLRKADEPRYYRANLGKFNISTKFSEWIEPDLLQVSAPDIKEIKVNRYKIDLATGEQTEPDISDLTRADANAEWKLDGLDAEKDKVKTSVVTEMLNSIDDLKIVGVRRKPEAVAAMLKGEKPKVTQSQMLELQIDMQSKGFVLQRGIIPVSGSVSVGTFKGIDYELAFGSVFSGTELDVEVGQSPAKTGEAAPAQDGEKTDAAKPAAEKEAEKAKDGEKTDAKTEDPKDAAESADGDAKKDDAKLIKSRYVFIQTRFDEKLLGEKPVAPVKPEPPKEEATKPDETLKTDDAKNDETKKDEAKADAAAEETKSDEKKTDDKPAEEARPAEKAPDAKAAAEAAKQKYEEALKEYQLQHEVYEVKKKQYEEKITEGKKRVEQLNARFANWYYVVSEDVYEGLRSKRADFIEPKDAPMAPGAGAGGGPMIPNIPGLPGFPLPGGSKAPETKAPAAEAPKDEAKPDAPAAKSDEAAKPADAPKPESKDGPQGEAKEAPKAEAAKPAEPKEDAKPEEPKAEEKPGT